VPNRLIAHLAHVEVLSPKPEESLRFYRDVLGLEESSREGGSVYLRAWGEWDHHSLKLTGWPPPIPTARRPTCRAASRRGRSTT
jgi:catechol 2,3-dioxygenase